MSKFKRNKGNEPCINNVSALIDNYQIRTEAFDGKEYYIAPVVMLKEGVHNGSGGPMYYPPEEIAKSVGAWNGVPVTLDHPKAGDMPCSANSPTMLTKHKVGRIFNAVYDNGDLKAEVWLETAKLKELAPGVLDLVMTSGRLPVSTGLFTDDQAEVGDWNGEDYVGTVHNFRPDHLALLPNSDGACSWADGCGIRANMEGERGSEYLTGKEMFKAFYVKGNFSNKISLDSTMGGIYRAIGGMDTQNIHHYVRDVYKDFVVFEKYNVKNDSPSKLFKQEYSVDGDGVVTLTGEPSEVKEKVTYVKVTANQITQKEEKQMKKDKCCPEKVQLLIENEATPFTEDNRDWLEGLDAAEIDKLMPLTDDPKANEGDEGAVAAAAQAGHDNAVEGKDIKAIVDEAIAANANADTAGAEEVTVESYIANAPAEFRDVLTNSLVMHRTQKSQLVKGILANKNNKFSEAQLNGMEMDMLKNLAEMAQVQNYAGNGGGPVTPVVETEEALELPTMNFEK